ncbi:PHD finger protein 12 [Galleria mellonella]|uniref:PHD finger protein 12 n=1 Tax=Galleria mellonella TaxID=7137 RepID=A0ABM3MLT4_GALME|nr:PHD finger protein 12 [Galleria mellonella]
MSNVGYDLDTSGGLMPLIRALIKPPDEDLNVQKSKKSQHPYYKRPGKGHNHDSCDACGEGGDLICCDRCPASFHLGCYDPPLDENDIPAGLWLCRECRASDAEKPASSRSSRAQSPADNKSDTEKRTRSLRNNRTNSTKKKVKEEDEEEKKEPEKELTPMEVLVKAAKIMNPKQFELPREMRIPCIFPGTDKEGSKNGGASLVTVDAWGCVPLPAKTCFICQATCKLAPLLQCDYCPLLFHQDCLDPPLTALPTGRWMCPNHVEQYIDWKLVNSISATERVALWEKFTGPVDQHAIKVDFIRRARNPHPPFRVKVPAGVRGRVRVPRMVRAHYARPPPLLPARREYVRCRAVLKNLKESRDYYESESEVEDEVEKPKHQICLNMSCPQYDGGRCPHASPLRAATAADAADDLKAISGQSKLGRQSDESSELSDSDFEYLTAAVKKRRLSGGERRRGARRERLELRADGDAEDLLAAVDDQLQKLDDRLVKLLAWQRLQQVAWGEQAAGAWARAPLAGGAAAAVRRSLARARLQRHGLRRVPLPSELLSAAERQRIAAAVWGPPPPAPPPPPPPPPPPSAPPAHALHLPPRAALAAVHRPSRNGLGDGLGEPIPMRLSVLWVGTDSSCDVRLEQPPHLSRRRCRGLSPRHALIFMDEVTQHFELINYSEWGTRVNGVLYTCDATHSEHEPEHERERDAEHDAEHDADEPREPDEAEARANAVRDIVRHRMPRPFRVNGSLLGADEDCCGCGAAAAAAAAAGAWEGSALLSHGALLQFGCLLYVFSVTGDGRPQHDDPAL